MLYRTLRVQMGKYLITNYYYLFVVKSVCYMCIVSRSDQSQTERNQEMAGKVKGKLWETERSTESFCMSVV